MIIARVRTINLMVKPSEQIYSESEGEMTELLIKILTDCGAWISNGQFRIYEQAGTYYISKRQSGGAKWQVLAQFEDITIALSKYIELSTEES